MGYFPFELGLIAVLFEFAKIKGSSWALNLSTTGMGRRATGGGRSHSSFPAPITAGEQKKEDTALRQVF